MANTRIKGGRVYLPSGPVEADILIAGEKITGLVSRDDPSPAEHVIDASGKWVLPGLVDLHAHTRVPGHEDKEDYATSSAAAAAGGVTTYVDMPNVDPPTTDAALMLAKKELAQRDCYIDWGHFPSASTPDNVRELAEAGATGFKIFMLGGGYPHDERIAVYDSATLYLAMEEVEKTGLPLLIHPFAYDLRKLFARKAVAENPGVPKYKLMAEVYVKEVNWATGVAQVLQIQRATNARVHVLHTHAAESLRMLRQFKQEGGRVTSALDVKYFHLKVEDYDRLGQRNYPGGYVVADKARMAEIWRSLADGTIDCIDSDHAPFSFEHVEKLWSSQGGSPHYQHMLSVLLNDVNEGAMTIETLVRKLCENPARMIGWFPEKGAIQVGTDADLVIVDMDKEHELLDGDHLYTKLKWTPYHGWRVRGAPVLTMLRGTVIAKDDTVVGQQGYGRYISGQPQRFVEPKPGESPGLALEPRG